MSIIKGTDKIVAGFGGTKRSIGEVYFSQSALATDNSGALPLFTGETIASANTIYPDFYNWVLAHTELQCTSAEYEAALTTYGECAKYVIGSGSLRLPLIKNYIKAANPSEGIKNIEAGLPNITGYFDTFGAWYDSNLATSGAFTTSSNQSTTLGISGGGGSDLRRKNFDASLSNPIYGKSSTVTPASTTLYPWVVAYTVAIPASTAQAAEFQQALSGKADTNLANIASNIDYVVDSYNDANGNWYRVYKSGWIEQGGQCSAADDATVTITFHKPFTNTSYRVLSGIVDAQLGGSNFRYISFSNFTTTTMKVAGQSNSGGSCRGFWYACGQGAN